MYILFPFLFFGIVLLVFITGYYVQDYFDKSRQIKNLIDENKSLWDEKNKITKTYREEILQKRLENEKLQKQIQILTKSDALLHKAIGEIYSGCPSLLEALKIFDEIRDNNTVAYLRNKSHPAYTAAQIVSIETRRRREAEFQYRNISALLEYYFSVFPDIQDRKEDITSNDIEIFSEDKNEDIVGRYLSKEEYFQLSTTERNQLALDRFWAMKKSKHLIGRLYEQYIGYLYECDGWLVDYYGISKGFSDLGRDLICHKNITTLLIQCKNWSKSKTIYEKHIFQLFGTTYEYMKNNPFEEVRGVFYTSTSLSDLARSFAKNFNIELHEKFTLQRFPIIKCNIGRDGERIYHLPFDQQYYNTKINPKDGDFYCASVAEAEAKGFRRAYRWRGSREEF